MVRAACACVRVCTDVSSKGVSKGVAPNDGAASAANGSTTLALRGACSSWAGLDDEEERGSKSPKPKSMMLWEEEDTTAAAAGAGAEKAEELPPN